MERVGGHGRYQVVKGPIKLVQALAKNAAYIKHITRYGSTFLSIENYKKTKMSPVGICEYNGSNKIALNCNLSSDTLTNEFNVVETGTDHSGAKTLSLQGPDGNSIAIKENETLIIKGEGARDVASIGLSDKDWLTFASLDRTGMSVLLKPKFYPDPEPKGRFSTIQRNKFLLQGLLMNFRWGVIANMIDADQILTLDSITKLLEQQGFIDKLNDHGTYALSENHVLSLQVNRMGSIIGSTDADAKGEEHYEAFIIGSLSDIFGFKLMELAGDMRLSGIPEYNAPLPAVLEQIMNASIPNRDNSSPSFFSNGGIN